MQRMGDSLTAFVHQISSSVNRLSAANEVNAPDGVRLLASGLATSVLGFLFMCQLVAFLINFDTSLVRLSSFLYHRISIIGNDGSVFMKCFLTIAYLRFVYRINFNNIRSTMMILISMRSGLDWLHLELQRFQQSSAVDSAISIKKILCMFLVTATTIFFTNELIYRTERAMPTSHLAVVVVEWLATTVVMLGRTAIMLGSNANPEGVAGMFIVAYSNLFLHSLFYFANIYFLVDASGAAASFSRLWCVCMIAHFSIPQISYLAEVLRVHRISSDLRQRFIRATKTDISGLSADDLCPICLSAHCVPDSMKLPCGHFAHSDCVLGLLKLPQTDQHRCPVCRASVYGQSSEPTVVDADEDRPAEWQDLTLDDSDADLDRLLGRIVEMSSRSQSQTNNGSTPAATGRPHSFRFTIEVQARRQAVPHASAQATNSLRRTEANMQRETQTSYSQPITTTTSSSSSLIVPSGMEDIVVSSDRNANAGDAAEPTAMSIDPEASIQPAAIVAPDNTKRKRKSKPVFDTPTTRRKKSRQ